MPGSDRDPAVALVTGAASGIGQACLSRLAGDGWFVVAGWRTRPPAEDVPAVQFDVTRSDEVDRALAEISSRYGPVEVVVSNAGRAHLDLALRVRTETARAVVDTNLAGSFHLVRAAGSAMATRRVGCIVLVGSAAGSWGVPGVSAYAASKAGLVGLMRTTARELGPRGVSVNVVAPGMLDDAVDRLELLRPRSGVADAWLEATPARRHGTADDVASVVSFLVSPGGRAITGAVVAVDGGFATGLG